jgi:hypothetical protein
MYGYLVNPYEDPNAVAEAEAMFEKIKILSTPVLVSTPIPISSIGKGCSIGSRT